MEGGRNPDHWLSNTGIKSKIVRHSVFHCFIFLGTHRRFFDISILKNLTLRFGKFAHAIPSHNHSSLCEKIKEVAPINKWQFDHLLLTAALL